MFQSQIWLIFTGEPRFELQLASASRCLDTGWPRDLAAWRPLAAHWEGAGLFHALKRVFSAQPLNSRHNLLISQVCNVLLNFISVCVFVAAVF